MVANSDKAYLGSIKVKVDVPDFNFKNREHLREFRRQMRLAHEAGIKEGVRILKRILSAPAYTDTGNLMKSVAQKLFIRTTDIFEGNVHFNEPGNEYAYFVEHGRGPGGAPPYLKMKAWGERKGLSFEKTMAIRNKIKFYGVAPRPFMDRAEREIDEKYSSIVDKAVDRFRKGT